MIQQIRTRLFELQDIEYKEFSAKLMPTVNKNTVIGVRTPVLKRLAKEIKDKPDVDTFLNDLPHKYYEENNLHSFIISEIKDFDKAIAEINRFLPCVDNWATCDGMRSKAFAKNKVRLLNNIEDWLDSAHTYTVRFGVLMLMTHFLDNDFEKKYLMRVAAVKSDEYYINMMLAWYFATALAKQWDSTIGFIEKGVLPEWVHNKTIQKAVESYRITDSQKALLKKLKV